MFILELTALGLKLDKMYKMVGKSERREKFHIESSFINPRDEDKSSSSQEQWKTAIVF